MGRNNAPFPATGYPGPPSPNRSRSRHLPAHLCTMHAAYGRCHAFAATLACYRATSHNTICPGPGNVLTVPPSRWPRNATPTRLVISRSSRTSD